MEVTGYEARQTSKEQTKMPRFMLEGPRPCTIFCFALTHYMNYVTNTFLLVRSSVQRKQLLCFVQSHLSPKRQTKICNKELIVRFQNYSSLLTMFKINLFNNLPIKCLSICPPTNLSVCLSVHQTVNSVRETMT